MAGGFDSRGALRALMPVAKKKRGVSKQTAFLAAFVTTASVTKAAKAAKVDRALHYRWLDEDPAYAKQFDAAKEQAAQVLEDEAIRRAYEGIEEPLVYQGQFTYKEKYNPATGKTEKYGKPLAIRKYSDGLLQFLLKGFRPEKYRDRASVEHSAPGGGPIQLDVESNEKLKQLSDAELAAALAVARKLTPATET